MSVVIEMMPPVLRRVRAYFAPVDRSTETPTIFDPAESGGFDLDAPPTPWIDLGWIDGFKRTCATQVVPLRSGAPSVTQLQVRTQIETMIEFAFEGWGKLQLALAAGTQQMNLLTPAAGAAATGSGGSAKPATTLLTGSTATVLQIEPTSGGGIGPPGGIINPGLPVNGPVQFGVGQLVAVDIDCAAQTGFVGSGLPGAYIKNALSDVDYIRRVTLNVGRIASANDGALTLEAPLLAGVPTAEMKVSSVVGFCDREGSSFFQEWSGLFVGEGQQGERVIWHYPRLQAAAGIGESATQLTEGFEAVGLRGSFRALPVVDPVDGETVVCFRSYVTGLRGG